MPGRSLIVRIATVSFALAGLTAIWPRSAFAQDWRYCVAQDEATGRFYLSEAFPSDKPIDSLEQAFNAFLDKTGVSHHWGICPRADNAFDAAADVAHAAQYNRLMGLEQRIVTWPDQPL